MSALSKILPLMRREQTAAPRPIKPGDYGRALLAAYEDTFGPAIGADVAYAVELYAKDGGYFPPIDAGHQGLQRMQGEFREHLHWNARRFRENIVSWHRQTHASFPHVSITGTEAFHRAQAAVMKYLLDVFDSAKRFHESSIVPLIKHLNRIERLPTTAEVASFANNVDDYYEQITASHARMMIRICAYYEQFSHDDDACKEVSFFHHDTGTTAQGIISDPEIISYHLGSAIESFAVEDLRQALNGWHLAFARFATSVHSTYLRHAQPIDNEVLAQLRRFARLKDHVSALDYAEFLGALVIRDIELSEGIDNGVLRKIFAYTVGNANDFPREKHEYPDGERFEVVVTVREDAIEISDNGRGMTPERLAEVRQAIEEGHELASDHGGTGRGLAVDVGQHLLPKLFPTATNPATLTINSTLGVGTIVTIHFPPSIVK